jgi:hypothetical protein
VSWLSWHQKSEQLASEAHILVRRGEQERAIELFSGAAEAEHQALLALDLSKARTFGITAVSAVSLSFKARRFSVAEKLAFYGLARHELPAFAVEQLKNLLQAIWIEQAKESAGISFLPGQVTVSVKGGQTLPGGAPLDLIVDKVQIVQALFYRTIEFLKGLPHRKRGAANIDIQEACRPWLFQALPGSYQFSVAIQEPRQADFFKDTTPRAENVALHFMSILKASTEDPLDSLAQLVPAEDYRATFLKLTRNLAPTGKNFTEVEVRASEETRGVSLVPQSRKTISQALKPKIEGPVSPEEKEVELRGILRALHLEKDWLELIVEGHSVHIDGLDDAVDDVIGPMVNKPVIVRANRRKQGRLRFIDIETED